MMTALLLAAAAELAGAQFDGDCAALARTVQIADGEATTVSFEGLELALDAGAEDATGSVGCRVTLQLAPPAGFRAGINGVHVRGAAAPGANGGEGDLIVRAGAPGQASHASVSRTLTETGAFDVPLGGGTLWFGCGEPAPEYAVTLDLSGFQPAAAATVTRARIDSVTFGPVVYRRCPGPAQP